MIELLSINCSGGAFEKSPSFVTSGKKALIEAKRASLFTSIVNYWLRTTLDTSNSKIDSSALVNRLLSPLILEFCSLTRSMLIAG